MRGEKGITTASIIVYVIVAIVVVSLLSVVTGYFRHTMLTNLREDRNNSKYIEFASYFVQDIEQQGNEVLTAKEMEDAQGDKIYYIQFSNGNIYEYSQGNKIPICEDVDLCQFIYGKDKFERKTVTVYFKAGDFVRVNDNAITFYM